jgi:hypothetical protein
MRRPPLTIVNCGRQRIPMSTDLRDHLVRQFGADSYVPRIEPPEIPLTPEQSLNNAAEFVMAMSRRGYRVMSGLETEDPRRMYDRSLMVVDRRRNREMMAARQERRPAVPPDLFTDVANWVDARVVQLAVAEIKKLPFKFQGDDSMVVDNLRAKVAAVARGMRSQGLLDERKLGRRQLLKSTETFVLKCREIRREVIKEALSSGIVKLAAVTAGEPIRTEFPEFWPTSTAEGDGTPEKAKTVHRLDGHIGAYLDDTAAQLPHDYRISRAAVERNLNMTAAKYKKSMSRLSHGVTRAMAELPQTPVTQSSSAPRREPETPKRAQPVEIIGNPSRDLEPLPPADGPQNSEGDALDGASLMWQVCDPLEGVRKGAYADQLAGLKYLARDIHATKVEPVSNRFDLWSRAEEKDAADAERRPAPLPRLSTASRAALRMSRGQSQAQFRRRPYMGEVTSGQAYAYLQERTEDMDDDGYGDRTSRSIHDQLEEIWDTCGFSTSQKLAMVLKYTKTTEDSASIYQALAAWKKAFEVRQIYQQKYTMIKEYLRSGADRQAQCTRILLLTEYEKELAAAEEAMKEVTAYLKLMGDEFIFRRRKATEVINGRRQKLWKLKMDIGLGG